MIKEYTYLSSILFPRVIPFLDSSEVGEVEFQGANSSPQHLNFVTPSPQAHCQPALSRLLPEQCCDVPSVPCCGTPTLANSSAQPQRDRRAAPDSLILLSSWCDSCKLSPLSSIFDTLCYSEFLQVFCHT